MLDKDGYPDEKSIQEIADWDIGELGLGGLFDLIEENTNWSDRQIQRRGKRVIYYEYHTGGWSGNEDVIDALRRNVFFWACFWQKSTRGGHYYFEIPHPEWYPFPKDVLE